MVKVKICGVRDLIGARACAAIGVDYAGLNFVSSSPRSVTVAPGRRTPCPPGQVRACRRVPQREILMSIERVAEEVEFKWLQLHGDETPSDCRHLRDQGLQHHEGVAGNRAFEGQRIEGLGGVHRHVLLLDGKTPGSGKTFDWSLLKALPKLKGIEVGLAGGLTSTNVGDAVRTTGPYLVDTAGGVEVDGIQTERIASRHLPVQPGRPSEARRKVRALRRPVRFGASGACTRASWRRPGFRAEAIRHSRPSLRDCFVIMPGALHPCITRAP